MFLSKRYFTTGKPAHNLNYNQEYVNFINNYANKNYKLIITKCLCGIKNDELLSSVDRHGVKFELVICKQCGLIRAKNYWDESSVIDFYKNHYRNIIYTKINRVSLEERYNREKKHAESFKWPFINSILKKNMDKKFKIIDCGGGTGGTIGDYKNKCDCLIVDYDEEYLNFAKKNNYKTLYGGLEEIQKNNVKFDLIILSHVVEHWNNFNKEIENLSSICDNNTLIYIETPGIDSLKDGRSRYDLLLRDIHYPHYYYFTSYVFNQIMLKFGFECIKFNNNYQGLFKFTGNKKENMFNFYDRVKSDLILAEKLRLRNEYKILIKPFIPKKFIDLYKLIRDK